LRDPLDIECVVLYSEAALLDIVIDAEPYECRPDKDYGRYDSNDYQADDESLPG
jgi:hypothetical protein